ncbi:hypothetical protein D9M71_137400 [compost metagenome]
MLQRRSIGFWPILAIAAFALSGCATPVPKQSAIDTGVFVTSPAKSPDNTVVGGASKRVAVILNDNTKNNTEYLKSRASQANERVAVMSDDQRRAEEMAADPNFAISWIAKSLKKQFGQVSLISDLAKFNAGSFDYLAIVDTYYVPIDWHWSTPTVDAKFEIAFYDRQGRFVTKATGQRAEQISTYNFDSAAQMRLNQHMVRVRALEQMDSSLQHIVVGTSQAPAEANASNDACVTSALRVANPTLRATAIGACGAR